MLICMSVVSLTLLQIPDGAARRGGAGGAAGWADDGCKTAAAAT